MNIQWHIDQLFCYPVIGDYVDVVFSAAWRVTGTDGTYFAITTGNQSLNPYVTGSTFIPYEDLQEAQVIAWVQNAMGDSQVAAINAGIEQKIAAQITPTVITPPLPWATV
jgi:hypothetical protein